MKATIVDRKWVVEWFDERQCYHMPSLTLAPNGNLLAVWNGGFLQWNGDPMGRDAKDWVSVLEPGAEAWSNPDAVGCDIRYCCHDPIFIQNRKSRDHPALRQVSGYGGQLHHLVQRPRRAVDAQDHRRRTHLAARAAREHPERPRLQ